MRGDVAVAKRKKANRLGHGTAGREPKSVPSLAEEEIAGPTLEQQLHGRFDIENITDKRKGGASITIGTAYRRKPMIDILADQGVFSDAEYTALAAYRNWASVADRSLTHDSLARHLPRGTGDGPTMRMLSAIQRCGDCERAAGSLRDILRAVAVDDMSLSQWAMKRYGSVQEGVRIKPKRKALAIVRLEIQMAAKRVQAELEA